eukprot:364389-Chlamydomonas_euryale.AAC.3
MVGVEVQQRAVLALCIRAPPKRKQEPGAGLRACPAVTNLVIIAARVWRCGMRGMGVGVEDETSAGLRAGPPVTDLVVVAARVRRCGVQECGEELQGT